MHVTAGPTNASTLTKRALLSCRLPEPSEPLIDIPEFDLDESETGAFRVHLPELKEWTHYPEEGSPDSARLLDVISTYAADADAVDARCGALGSDKSGQCDKNRVATDLNLTPQYNRPVWGVDLYG